MPTRLAVVGDVHRAFTPATAAALDARGYDGVLFVGDLGDRLHRGVQAACRAIARLRTPAVLVPGNHDGPSPLGVLACGLGLPTGSGRRTLRRTASIRDGLGPVALGGYSVHGFGELSVVVGRPWSMGGLCFAGALDRAHGVRNLEGSTRRLQALVAATPGDLVFLAHNGPRGLPSLWGERGRDRGDLDLTEAIAAAGPRARVVVAGHVHHRGERAAPVVRGATTYVNAARVPMDGWVELTVGERVDVRWRRAVDP